MKSILIIFLMSMATTAGADCEQVKREAYKCSIQFQTKQPVTCAAASKEDRLSRNMIRLIAPPVTRSWDEDFTKRRARIFAEDWYLACKWGTYQ